MQLGAQGWPGAMVWQQDFHWPESSAYVLKAPTPPEGPPHLPLPSCLRVPILLHSLSSEQPAAPAMAHHLLYLWHCLVTSKCCQPVQWEEQSPRSPRGLPGEEWLLPSCALALKQSPHLLSLIGW